MSDLTQRLAQTSPRQRDAFLAVELFDEQPGLRLQDLEECPECGADEVEGFTHLRTRAWCSECCTYIYQPYPTLSTSAEGALLILDELRDGDAVKTGLRPAWIPQRWKTDLVGRWSGQLECTTGDVVWANEWSTEMLTFPEAISLAACAALYDGASQSSRDLLWTDPTDR